MSDSNSLYFEVKERADVIGRTPVEDEDSGLVPIGSSEISFQQLDWEVQVRKLDEDFTLLTIITEYIELVVGPELGATGHGSITLDQDSPIWDTFLDAAGAGASPLPFRDVLTKDYLWQAYEGGVLRFEWIGRTKKENILVSGETKGTIVSGPGTAETLEWASVFPPGFPTTTIALAREFNQFDINGLPVGPRTTSMGAWLILFAEAQARGASPWAVPLFTAQKDSGGVVWTDFGHEVNLRLKIGESLLDLLDICTGQNLNEQASVRAEWVMWPGFQLQVSQGQIGQHREDKVVFHELAVIRESEHTRISDEIANYVVIQDVYGRSSVASNTTSINRWNRREHLEQRGNITDDHRRSQVAAIVLNQRKDETSEWVIKAQYGALDRRPFEDFNLGDYVGIEVQNTHTGESAIEVHRVLSIIIRVPSDGDVEMELILQSRMQEKQRELQKRLTALLNQPGVNNPGFVTPPAPAAGQQAQSLIWEPEEQAWGLGVASGCESATGVSPCVFISDIDPALVDDPKSGDFWYQL